jgi:hypothetical protein
MTPILEKTEMAKLMLAVALVAIAEHGIKCGELVEGTPGQIKALGEHVDASKGAVAYRRSESVKVTTLPDNAPEAEMKEPQVPLIPPAPPVPPGGPSDTNPPNQ